MAVYPTTPATPPGKSHPTDITDLMGDLVMPAAPRKATSTKPSVTPSTPVSKSHQVQAGRVTKRPSILKLSSKSSKQNGRRVHFENLFGTVAPKAMEPPRTPPRGPRFQTTNEDATTTPNTMPEPITPLAAPHRCLTGPGVKCSECARLEQESARLVLANRTCVSLVRGSELTYLESTAALLEKRGP